MCFPILYEEKYYEVLSQSDKSSEQQFYNNVEDQTVQYMISPDKTQYPTQQIVVTSGEQLMVVDGQQQQIVIDQTSGITYQSQQIQPQQIQVQVQQQSVQLQQQIQQSQVHVQQQQYAVIQDGLTNGTQQIFYMDSNSNDRVVMEQTGQQPELTQQPIVLNHQLSQGNTIVTNKVVNPAQLQRQVRANLRQPLLQQPARLQNRQLPRPPVANQQLRQQNPNQQPQPSPNQTPMRLPATNQVRQPNPQLQVRQPAPNQMARPMGLNQQQYRLQNPGQVRPQNPNQQQQMKLVNPNQQPQVKQQVQQRLIGQPLQKNQGVNPRFQAVAQMQQQQKINTQPQIDMEDMEIKSSDEQEAISLPDGTVISVAAYKKMIAEQKRAALQQRNQPVSSPNQPAPPTAPANSTAKRRNATPRGNPRQTTPRPSPARPPARSRNPASQFTPPPQQPRPQQPPPQVNDPARYAMMNQAQQQGMTKPQPQPQPQQQFQTQMQNQLMQQQQQMQRSQQARQSQANYVIQPPKPNQKPQQQRPLPPYIPSTQIQKIIENTPVGEEFSDSIRMLVLLENGEQRLITFTLPKEACTIQEILEQVNVPFRNDTDIQVTEANTNGINYIVTVGNVPCFGYEEEESPPMQEESSPPSQPPPVASQPAAPQPQAEPQQMPPSSTPNTQLPPEPPKVPTPEPPKEVPKFVPGMLALCAGCGYLSEDFAKCIRCGRKLPDNVKAIPATIRSSNGQKKDLQGVHQQPKIAINLKPQSPSKKKATKASKVVEHESVVISSDEEEEDKPTKVDDNILQKLGSSITISPVTKEPSTNDIQKHSIVKPKVALESDEEDTFVSTSVKCRTIRIGSYRCVPPEKVIIDSKQVIMKVTHPNCETDVRTIKVDKSEIVKVLASFNKALPVFFYYLNPALAKTIREELDMTPDGDYYYDPLSSKEEAYRRVTLLPDEVNDDDKQNFQLIYGGTPGILDELNVKEANDILIKTCPKELSKATLGLGGFGEVKQLLTYPPEGRGRITINTEDYLCLAQDQFLNDVIIDFYLKFLVENLPNDQKQKVHVFSTFFYKRLTTKPTKASRKCQPAELDPSLSPAQKRHARVKTWTKKVNLFEKDFVVVPINENAHWFLAIICFPGMDGCQTWDGKPYKLEVRSRKKKKDAVAASVAGVSITPVKQEKVEKPIVCEDPDMSDKDEAEGDDSELDSDDSDELPLSQSSVTSSAASIPPTPVIPITTSTPVKHPKEPRPKIKQPCILIFDSLAGASRSRVVATLRDYLTCEYKAKLNKERIYNKDVIKGASPKVPQQNNFTDCGLYLLQYVEQFFTDPIKDYHIPILQIKNWFEEIIVTKKREDIANLIKDLMRDHGKDVGMLPDIAFPTFNGKLVEREPEDEEEEMMEDEDFPTEEDLEDMKDESGSAIDTSVGELGLDTSPTGTSKDENSQSPMKPSNDNVSGDFVSQTVLNPKPDISEFPRQTNRDTLSYLKAKRIIRHKNNDGPDVKKQKSEHTQ
ncbi:uncharacterized protein LOC108909755 isoform X2 [Anoplophora glabripennis]|uniref:uncharacterized protein LOC108909755 isoform X2 n=1 Tax=Anoplophora glabripennis TaxID=217634 RepID=UPI000874F638|nr:uncharacterized protein LOC108909755 isoform X2 [Anoplophora glabripennis]